eukprot:180525-Chlamydomonas_euryale.AAC.5
MGGPAYASAGLRALTQAKGSQQPGASGAPNLRLLDAQRPAERNRLHDGRARLVPGQSASSLVARKSRRAAAAVQKQLDRGPEDVLGQRRNAERWILTNNTLDLSP